MTGRARSVRGPLVMATRCQIRGRISKKVIEAFEAAQLSGMRSDWYLL